MYTAKPISECRLVSSWSAFYGTTSLEHLSYNAIHGTLFMEHFLWNTFHGTLFMERLLWNTHGTPSMQHFSWNAFHGTPSMEHFLWNAFHGTHSTSFRAVPKTLQTDGRTDVHTKIPGGPTSTEIGKALIITQSFPCFPIANSKRGLPPIVYSMRRKGPHP